MSNQETSRWLRWPAGMPQRLAFGADYNPEQWPRHIWDDDVRAMRAAGVNIVSIGVFSWARLQPAEHSWNFDWLDEIMDLLHINGIAVDLGTATASPPRWLTTKHPEILPVNREGATVWPGARQHWRPTSPVFLRHALRLVSELAHRYGSHPALAAWHISNELGCHNVYDYSDDAANAFRTWLRTRYGTLDTLNHAWGTSFWSQHYSDWDQILPPRLAGSHPNPTQQLDFKRFSSDALKDYLIAERKVLTEITPDVPLTTNFMVMGEMRGMNYADWADEIDFVSNDHYTMQGPQALDELSFSANLTGNIAGGRPWFLMEHSTSAVNWQPINLRKRDAELGRDSLTHVAHGADAVCFFQWRQSKAGAEKYHSGMMPHAGEDSDIYRAVVDLGQRLGDLAAVSGSHRARAPVAIVFDWDSWWACEQDSHPNEELRYRQEALNWYSALLDAGIRADVVPLSVRIEDYPVVIAPILHVVPQGLADRLTGYVGNGGHLVTTYFSGIVDENDHIWLGGYPGALRDLLGIRIQEFSPLPSLATVALDNGALGALWTDPIEVTHPDTQVIVRYASGDLEGRPAITRRTMGSGSATYVSTMLAPDALRPLIEEVAHLAGVTSELPDELRGRVELTIRSGADSDYWFLINRTDSEIQAALAGKVLSAGGDEESDQTVRVAPRSVTILRRSASSQRDAQRTLI